jgi:G3E family GTPase
MSKIPFHIISGFLGSGKTTLLKKLIGDYSDKYRLGIIQNEFAPSNIDGAELKKSDGSFDLLEINNGSVFCVCLLGDFVSSLNDFIIKFNPEIIIIEASGLSDTTSVVEVISSGQLAEKIFLASNWCIVDAQNFSRSGLMRQRIYQQIRMADIVIINKTDLNGSHGINGEIKKLNPFAEIRESAWCNTDLPLGGRALGKYYPYLPGAMNRPEVNSMVIKNGRRMDKKSLEIFLQKWAPLAYRIKGFVNTTDGRTFSVQCIYDNIELIESDVFYGPSELIAISGNFTFHEWTRSFRSFIQKI